MVTVLISLHSCIIFYTLLGIAINEEKVVNLIRGFRGFIEMGEDKEATMELGEVVKQELEGLTNVSSPKNGEGIIMEKD